MFINRNSIRFTILITDDKLVCELMNFFKLQEPLSTQIFVASGYYIKRDSIFMNFYNEWLDVGFMPHLLNKDSRVFGRRFNTRLYDKINMIKRLLSASPNIAYIGLYKKDDSIVPRISFCFHDSKWFMDVGFKEYNLSDGSMTKNLFKDLKREFEEDWEKITVRRSSYG